MYQRTFHVVFGTRVEALRHLFKYVTDDSKNKIEEAIENANGFVIEMSRPTGSLIVMFIKSGRKKNDINKTLIHEVGHATFEAMSIVGIKHCADTDEVFSYYNAWLYETITSKINFNKRA